MPTEVKLVKLIEERKLLVRFSIVARKHLQLDFEKGTGNCDFSVVLKLVFTEYGQSPPLTDKTKILYKIEVLPLGESLNGIHFVDPSSNRLVIFDGIALVNIVHKDNNLNTSMVNYFSKKMF